MLPTTEQEIEAHLDSMEIIDGQHRIIAFDQNYMSSLMIDQPYEMIFSVFDNASETERKELFMTTNEKQDKVATNLLRFIKKDLHMLTDEEDETYELLEELGKEPSSSLFGRIVFGSEKKTKAFQETQLSKIFNTYGVKDFYNREIKGKYATPLKNYVKIISNYLRAWEQAAEVDFKNPGKETITKVSGLRYLMIAFPEICRYLKTQGKTWKQEDFRAFIEFFPKALDLNTVRDVFNDDNSKKEEQMIRSYAFRGEGATSAMAKQDIAKVLSACGHDNKVMVF
jgi:DGQHR domain-containing protein